MKSSLFFLSLPAMGLAFPGFMGVENKAEILDMLNEKRSEETENKKRAGILSTLVNDVSGLLGSVASSVDPANLRPEPGYTFQAPGPGDSRGPCPGLNLLANYGYLPRNGYVNYGQVVDATARGFNMGADLATVLAVFAILADGDIATESWYLGTDPNSDVGGLNRHSTVEADISPNREDYYLGCGDNHHVSSRLFQQNVKYAAASADKQFTIPVMAQQYAANSKFSQKYNPYLYYFPFPSIVSLGAFAFYPNFFSNGTYGAGGVANYESISSIIGAQLNTKTGNYEYVPEKWPTNWYRRSTEYGAVAALTQAFLEIYPSNPVGMPFGQLGTGNFNAQDILCDAVQGINSITPLILAGEAAEVEAGIAWALTKLDPYFNATVLGCPTSALSKNVFFPEVNQTGGPVNPPPTVANNAGNNVYKKTYFTTAPTSPQCSHSS